MNEKIADPYEHLSADEYAAIAEIESTSHILQLVTRLTAMRFAAISKFTDTHWVACSVSDDGDFGIDVGDVGLLETSLCNQMRVDLKALFISSTSESSRYVSNPSVQKYGFESFIAVPVVCPDGRLFGALCAMDPEPKEVNDADLIDTLTIFSRLIGCVLFNHVGQVRLGYGQELGSPASVK